VVEAIEGKIAAVLCVQDPDACVRAVTCVATRVWKRLSEDIERSLSSFTLAALASQARELAAAGPNFEI
jgi:DNA-binding IscR family transcriptional regulator